MPTANLQIAPGQALPPFGVYAARVIIGDEMYAGVTNVGLRPSLNALETPTVETFILDYAGDLYGEEITLHLISFLRSTRKMSSLEAVHQQVLQDAEAARKLVNKA